MQSVSDKVTLNGFVTANGRLNQAAMPADPQQVQTDADAGPQSFPMGRVHPEAVQEFFALALEHEQEFKDIKSQEAAAKNVVAKST